MKKYISNIFNVLFSPKEAFETLKAETTMPLAIATIGWTNSIFFFARHRVSSGFWGDAAFLATYVFSMLGILFVWFASGLFFEFTARIFSKSGRLRTLLTLSAYSLLPYIFVAPFELMKKFSPTGYFFGTKLEILLYLWVIILYARALEKTYEIKFSSSLSLIFLPLLAVEFAVIWLIGTLFNLGYIYSV